MKNQSDLTPGVVIQMFTVKTDEICCPTSNSHKLHNEISLSYLLLILRCFVFSRHVGLFLFILLKATVEDWAEIGYIAELYVTVALEISQT